MLEGKLSDYAKAFVLGDLPAIRPYGQQVDINEHEGLKEDDDRGPAPGNVATAQVTLSITRGGYQLELLVVRIVDFQVGTDHHIYYLERSYPKDLQALALYINQPGFPIALRQFLFQQRHPDSQDFPENLPEHSSRIDVFHSAVATFYAPSDLCGAGGMYRERIWSNMK